MTMRVSPGLLCPQVPRPSPPVLRLSRPVDPQVEVRQPQPVVGKQGSKFSCVGDLLEAHAHAHAQKKKETSQTSKNKEGLQKA